MEDCLIISTKAKYMLPLKNLEALDCAVPIQACEGSVPLGAGGLGLAPHHKVLWRELAVLYKPQSVISCSQRLVGADWRGGARCSARRGKHIRG